MKKVDLVALNNKLNAEAAHNLALSPCCRRTIEMAWRHNILVGVCMHCGTDVARVNPENGRQEWLDDNHFTVKKNLRHILGVRLDLTEVV